MIFREEKKIIEEEKKDNVNELALWERHTINSFVDRDELQQKDGVWWTRIVLNSLSLQKTAILEENSNSNKT